MSALDFRLHKPLKWGNSFEQTRDKLVRMLLSMKSRIYLPFSAPSEAVPENKHEQIVSPLRARIVFQFELEPK